MSRKPRNDITREQVLAVLDYEPETGRFRWRYRADWGNRINAVFAGKIAGGYAHGYWQIRIGGHLYWEHRLVWLVETGDWPVAEIDHINREGMDNRFSNLRNATHAQNCLNTDVSARSKSGIKGVYWRDDISKWAAQITVDGKCTTLGAFLDVQDAALAYRLAAVELHGKFAQAEAA